MEHVELRQAAAATGKNRRTVYNWLRCGELPAKKIGRMWLVNRKDIEGGK
jgi:excisionase family DNA binding protein